VEAFKPFLAKIAERVALTRAEAEEAFGLLLSGDASPAQTGAFLMGLRLRGETLDELTGAVSAMRARMLRVQAPEGAIDVVGTGGDGAQTYNISTLAAIIVAACGVPVAKHGNRAASSFSGASDVLTGLGVRIGIPPKIVEHCLRETNIGFMTAQAHHPAMAVVAPFRRELGVRTLFNLLGPLSNPAGVTRALIGVADPKWMDYIAQTLATLGAEKVWIAHGSDGLDEITTTGPTEILELDHGKTRRFQVTPEQAGLGRATLPDLRGGDPATNASALRAVLNGQKNAYRDIAVLNASAALIVAGKAEDLASGARLAEAALDSGKARDTLENLIRLSKETAENAAE
jgi:anthranilate phosphoribosyltransferase